MNIGVNNPVYAYQFRSSYILEGKKENHNYATMQLMWFSVFTGITMK